MSLKEMHPMLIMLIAMVVVVIATITCTTVYELWEADDNLIQSEIEISEIIDEKQNITREQKRIVIDTICDGKNPIDGMAEKCKMDMFLKYME